MANFYVWSGAGGTANGSSWANAYKTLAAALSGKNGDTLFVAHDHLEASASQIVLSSSSTISTPCKIICVNRAGAVPPTSVDRRNTAKVSTTGNSGIVFFSWHHYDGIIFVAGNSTGVALIQIGSQTNNVSRFDNCSLQIGSTGAGAIEVNAAATYFGIVAELNNTTMSFADVSQSVVLSGTLRWRNTAALLGAPPTTLFKTVAGRGAEIECIGVDLSTIGSGKTLVATANASAFLARFADCKIDDLATKASVPGSSGASKIDFTRSGAAAANYAIYCQRSSGVLTEERTIIRAGGASDGVTPIAWKIVTTGNATYLMPMECPPIAIWCNIVASPVTATVQGICSGAMPNNDECWMEAEYLGNGSSPLSARASDGKADLLAAAAAQDVSTATWGGALSTKFKLNVTFTPQQRGWVYVRVKISKPSSTYYIDPLVTLT